MIGPVGPRSLPDVKRWFLLTLIAFGLLLFALAGWTAQGIRWTLPGSRRRRTRLATV
jgi:hypothetical protein